MSGNKHIEKREGEGSNSRMNTQTSYNMLVIGETRNKYYTHWYSAFYGYIKIKFARKLCIHDTWQIPHNNKIIMFKWLE